MEDGKLSENEIAEIWISEREFNGDEVPFVLYGEEVPFVLYDDDGDEMPHLESTDDEHLSAQSCSWDSWGFDNFEDDEHDEDLIQSVFRRNSEEEQQEQEEEEQEYIIAVIVVIYYNL